MRLKFWDTETSPQKSWPPFSKSWLQYLAAVTSPAETNIAAKETEKRTKYQDLLFELRKQYPEYTVKLIVLIIGVLGGAKPSLLATSLSIITCGLQYGWSSPSIPILLRNDTYIPITEDEGSWLAVAPLSIEVITMLIIPMISNKIGRKYSILLTAPVYLLSWGLIAVSRSFRMMMFGRLVAGFGDNMAFTAIPMYMAEVAHPQIRGALVLSIPVALYFGTFLMNIIGPLFTIPTTALISASLSVIQLLTFVWMPESPHFYLMKGNLEKARNSLQILRRTNDVDQELNDTAKAVARQQAEPGKTWDLFKVKSNRKAMLISLGLKTTQQLTGETTFMLYTQYIFQQAGGDISPYVSAIIYNGLQFLFSGVATGLVDRLGRRPLLIFSASGSAIALALEAIYFYLKEKTSVDLTGVSWLPVFAMLLFIFVFSMGYSTIPYLLSSELFPTGVKATALAFLDFYFAVLAAIVTKLFQFSASNYGLYLPFLVFSVSTIFTVFFVILYVPETKGLELEDILLQLKESKIVKNSPGESKIVKNSPGEKYSTQL